MIRFERHAGAEALEATLRSDNTKVILSLSKGKEVESFSINYK
ncbi:MAG: hypothetical protein ACI85F_001191 [Bacteroidia bacterium]|jgi:hypothetical protein